MTARPGSPLLLAAIAAAVVLAACGGTSCPTESPKISSLPPSCVLNAGAQVSVGIHVCPTCNQTSASCSVVDKSATDQIIQLDPSVEACTSNSSCPISCDTAALQCTFTAPATAGTYMIAVFNPETGQLDQVPLTVVASGGSTSCTG